MQRQQKFEKMLHKQGLVVNFENVIIVHKIYKQLQKLFGNLSDQISKESRAF